jgi:hypothetical protein
MSTPKGEERIFGQSVLHLCTIIVRTYFYSFSTKFNVNLKANLMSLFEVLFKLNVSVVTFSNNRLKVENVYDKRLQLNPTFYTFKLLNIKDIFN